MSDWFCHAQGRIQGPYAPQQLKLLVESGKLQPQDSVRKGMDGTWAPAAQVKGLFSPAVLSAFQADSDAVRAAEFQVQRLQSQEPAPAISLEQEVPKDSLMDEWMGQSSLLQSELAKSSVLTPAFHSPSAPIFRQPMVFAGAAVVLFAVVGVGIWSFFGSTIAPDNTTVADAGDKSFDENNLGLHKPSSKQENGAMPAADGQVNAGRVPGPSDARLNSTPKDQSAEGQNSSKSANWFQVTTPYAEASTTTRKNAENSYGSEPAIEPTETASASSEGAEEGNPAAVDVQAPESSPAAEIYAAASAAVVGVEFDFGLKHRMPVPGYLLYPYGLVVTRQTTAPSAKSITITFSDNTTAQAAYIAKYISELGLVFLDVDNDTVLKYPMLKLVNSDARLGDLVIQPVTDSKRITRGVAVTIDKVTSTRVMQMQNFPMQLSAMITSVPMDAGDLSRPVLTPKGEMIGMVFTWPRSRDTSHTFILPASEIARLAPTAQALTAATKFEASGAKVTVSENSPSGPAVDLASIDSSAATTPAVPSRLILDPHERMAELERINDRRLEMVAVFKKANSEQTTCENDLAKNQVRFNQLAIEAADLKRQGEKVQTMVQMLESRLVNEQATAERQRIEQELALSKQRLQELKNAYTENLKQGKQVQSSVSELKSKLATAKKILDALHIQGENLRSEWVAQLDPFGRLPPSSHIGTLETLQSWIDRDPEFAGGYLAQGFASMNIGQMELAINDFGKAADLDINAEPLARAALGIALSRVGLQQEAQTEFGRALAKDKKLVIAYMFRGEHARLLGNCKQAESDFETAARLDEKFSEAYLKLAWLLATCTERGVRNGRKALEHAEKAQQLQGATTDWRILMALSAAYAEVGEKGKATEFAQQAKALAHDEISQDISQHLTQLEKAEPLRLE